MNTKSQNHRVFSPVILFNETNDKCIIDTELIQVKKQEINEMLKSNVQFWSHIIETTKDYSSPPETPPETSFYSPSHQYYYLDYKSNDELLLIHSDEEDEEEVQVDKKSSHIKNNSNSNNNNNNNNKKKNNNGRRRRGNLPKSVTAILKQWLIDHRGHPYPTEEEKRSLKVKTNLTLNQISNWFINARRRILPLILSTSFIENNDLYLQKKKLKRKRLVNDNLQPIEKKLKACAPLS